jgi:LysR family transcriptional activator of nhaA
MNRLNFRHLWYFHEIVRIGTLTEAAARLNLSPSALSAQIRTLEARLGHALFERVGRRLELTEAGRIVHAHAQRIFDVGTELLSTLEMRAEHMPPLRVGALSTLSRNFQIGFLRPLLDPAEGQDSVPLTLRSGTAAALLDALAAQALDVVLTTDPPQDAQEGPFRAHRIAEQPVSLHGRPDRVRHDSLAALLSAESIILPSGSAIRAEFLAITDALGIVPRVVAEVEDMAMIRLLAREGVGVALAPDVVVADELASGRLARAPFALGLSERFYAITVPRAFPHPALAPLLAAAAAGVASALSKPAKKMYPAPTSET